MALGLLDPGGTTGNQCATPRGEERSGKKGEIMTNEQKHLALITIAGVYYDGDNVESGIFERTAEMLTAFGCDFGELVSDLYKIAEIFDKYSYKHSVAYSNIRQDKLADDSTAKEGITLF